MGDGVGQGTNDWDPVFSDAASATNQAPVFGSCDHVSTNQSSDAAGARRRSWRRRNFSSLEARSWDQAKQEAKQTISKGIQTAIPRPKLFPTRLFGFRGFRT